MKFSKLYMCHSWHARWLPKFASHKVWTRNLCHQLPVSIPLDHIEKLDDYISHACWLPKLASPGLNLEVLSQDASLNTIRPQDSVEELDD